MKESRAALYPLITGIAGGLLAWCGVEWLLYYSSVFPDFRMFSMVLGGVAGLLLGVVAPSAEGLRQGQKDKIRKSLVIGGIAGAVMGALGMLVGQLLLSVISESMGSGVPSVWGGILARIPGWSLMGAGVGAASGIRSRSGRRVAAGILGGFIGGLCGGLVFELLGSAVGGFVGRVVGMLIWGLAVALLADRFEARRARGRLTVLSGPLKGRSFPVNQKNMTIAASPQADLTIPGDRTIISGSKAEEAPGKPAVTKVRLSKGTVVLDASAESLPVKVNDRKTEGTELRYDDVIKIGETTMIYEAGR